MDIDDIETDNIDIIVTSDIPEDIDFKNIYDYFGVDETHYYNELFRVSKSEDYPQVTFCGGSTNELHFRITNEDEFIKTITWLSEKIPEYTKWETPTVSEIPVKIDLGKNIPINEIKNDTQISIQEIEDLGDKPDEIYTSPMNKNNPSKVFGIYYTENGIAHIRDNGIVYISVNPENKQREIVEERLEEKVGSIKEQVENKIKEEQSDLVSEII